MTSNLIIDVPPRITRPVAGRPAFFMESEPDQAFDCEDDLRLLARQIVDHDPALALLLARAGDRVRKS
jgi:hypothetical protein